jgi:hypothetical protein
MNLQHHYIATYMQEDHVTPLNLRTLKDGNISKIETELTIIDKNAQEVPFTLKKPQSHFIRNAVKRNVILKARKMGFSSVALALALMRFIYKRNEKCVCVSFDHDAAKKQLERVKHFLRSWERYQSQTTGQDVKFPLKYNSKNELVFENTTPDGTTYVNTLRIGSAKSGAFGRGDDISFLHVTEVSMADHLDELLAGVGEAVINNSVTILETTANGYNQFKTFWDETTLGLRGYRPFFYDPLWEYTPEYLAQKEKTLGRLYTQEYPMTPEDAFITSGACYFDMEALKAYNDKARDPITTQFAYFV